MIKGGYGWRNSINLKVQERWFIVPKNGQMFSFSTDINGEFRKNFLWKVDWEALKCITRRQNGEGEEVGRAEYRGMCVCVLGECWGALSEVSRTKYCRELSFWGGLSTFLSDWRHKDEWGILALWNIPLGSYFYDSMT